MPDLTKLQRDVLREIGWDNHNNSRTDSFGKAQTVARLLELGLIEVVCGEMSYDFYRITAAGRATLAQPVKAKPTSGPRLSMMPPRVAPLPARLSVLPQPKRR